jgi:hypothetical protein
VVSVMPTVARVSPGAEAYFSVHVEGGADGHPVHWSVREGADGGTIDDSGRYRAPNASGTFHVLATSDTNPLLVATATVSVASPAGVAPVLVPGIWSDITPPGAVANETFGTPVIELDPTDAAVLYVCSDERGLWKSADAGSSWRRLGDPSRASQGRTVYYLDSPIRVRVDPRNPKRLLATQGVRGNTQGFWVSLDGGESWSRPAGFQAIAEQTTHDVTTLAVDPSNFDHLLLGPHSTWGDSGTAGLLESIDGGETWIKHAPQPGWTHSSPGLHFLYEPSMGIGNSQTWLSAQETGWWRTADGGETWSKVSTRSIAHGGTDIYYSTNRVLYAGAHGYPLRSDDNGLTWETLESIPNATYYTIQGDGETLYTQLSYTGDNGGRGPQPYLVSAEGDGNAWTAYGDGRQTFDNGPFVMRFEKSNRIMYSANWRGGIWALKVVSRSRP